VTGRAPGSHLDDADLSDLVDGLAGPETLAHVDRCDECAARVATWREALRLVAEAPGVPPASVRDMAVGAALAAAGEEADDRVAAEGGVHDGADAADGVDGADGADGAGPIRLPVSLTGRPAVGPTGRPPARPTPHRLRRLLTSRVAAAAAAVVLVGAGAFGISEAAGSHAHFSSAKSGPSAAAASPPGTAPSAESPTAARAGEGEASGSSGAASAGSSAGPSAGATAEPAPAPSSSLGSFDNLEDLATALKPRLASQGTAAVAPEAEVGAQAACRAESIRVARAGGQVASSGLPTYSAPVTYRGHPSWVYVFTSGSRRLAVVLSAAGCTTEGEITF
jgi:hypothetical protein